MQKPAENLTDFGKTVISVIIKYRLVTQGLLRTRFDKTETQVKNEVRRLTEKKLIVAHPFVQNERYYRLTRKACDQFGCSRRLSQNMGVQMLKMNYGLLHFCFTSSPPKRLLSEVELRDLLYEPDVSNEEPLPAGNFFIDSSQEQTRLAHVYVDCRSDARRLIRKAFGFIKDRMHIRPFRELVMEENISFVYVTETDGKAQAIREAGARKQLANLSVHVCPELTHL